MGGTDKDEKVGVVSWAIISDHLDYKAVTLSKAVAQTRGMKTR